MHSKVTKINLTAHPWSTNTDYICGLSCTYILYFYSSHQLF